MLINLDTHNIFVEDTKRYLDEIEKDLITLENMGADIAKPFAEKLFRSVQVIKSSAGLLGFSNIKELSQKLENVLGLISNGELDPNPEIVNILLLGFDRVFQLIENLHKSNDMEIDEQSVMLTGLTSAVLPDEKKKSVTQIRVIHIPSDKHTFQISEFNLLQVINQGKNIYILEYDLIHDVQMKKITPLNFVRFVQQHGEMIDSFLDIYSVGTLEEKTSEHKMPYFILFASSLDKEELSNELDLESNKIHDLKNELKDLIKTQGKVYSSNSECNFIESNVLDQNKKKILSDLTNEFSFAYDSLVSEMLEKKDSINSITLNRIGMVLSSLKKQVNIEYSVKASDALWKLVRKVRDYGYKNNIPSKLEIESSDINMDKRITCQLIEPISNLIIKMIDSINKLQNNRHDAKIKDSIQIIIQIIEEDKDIIIKIYSKNYSFNNEDILLDLTEEQKQINALNANCSQEQSAEKGVVLKVKLKQAYSILDGYNVKIDNQDYIFPKTYIKEWILNTEISDDIIKQVDQNFIILVQEKWIPFIDISSKIDIKDFQYFLNKKTIVICEVGYIKFAIGIDSSKQSEISVVLQPISKHLGKDSTIIANCLLTDGKIAFIPDMGYFAYQASKIKIT